jgi:hypothetical protein
MPEPVVIGQSAMSIYSPVRGKRKAARKFTIRQGLWIAGIVGVVMAGMLMLILLGYVNVDMD